MSTPTPPAKLNGHPALRELAGLLLIVLGVAVVDVVLFLLGPLPGIAALGVECVAVGVFLTLSEV